MISSRTVLSFLLLSGIALNVGCANVWHNLQPHRLQRLNRGPAPSLDPEFSSIQRKQQKQVAGQAPSDTATVSGNSAMVATVRAQSPE